MPVDTDLPKEQMIYQREQYQRGGLGVRYWDYRDRVALQYLMGDNIVDIGCGEGITLEKVVRQHPDKKIVGIDSEPENVDICRSHGLPVQRGSVFDLPFDSNSVDCVLFFEVIEHLDEPDKALAEVSRVLKPGGRAILIFPNDRTFLWARLATGMIKEAFYDAGHVKQWTPRDIDKALKDKGLYTFASHNLPFKFWSISLHHLVVAEKRANAA